MITRLSLYLRLQYFLMVQKRLKVAETTSYKEEVLFNSDTLSKIISYLTSIDLLNLALTCKMFGVYNTDTIQRFSISDDDNELSLIEKSARIAIKDIAAEEELAALPYYEGENSLADYHYLQSMRLPLTFDQLVGAEYVNSLDKTCVRRRSASCWGTAFSNNIMRAGKHYATFPTNKIVGMRLMVGAMRPGKASVNARSHPHDLGFYQNFSPNIGRGECNNNNNIHSCLFNSYIGSCYTSDWRGSEESRRMESIPFDDEIGLQLDLDDGTLSVYKNGRKLGVVEKGLAGPYCWVVSMYSYNGGAQVTIRRGAIPPS